VDPARALGRVAVLAVITTVLLAAGPGDWGLWLGLGLAVGLIVAGSALRRNVPLGIGAAGMVVCSWASSPAGTGATSAPPWPFCWSGWAWSRRRWCWPGRGPPRTTGRGRPASVEDGGQGVDDPRP
jgi:hypothetical protein